MTIKMLEAASNTILTSKFNQDIGDNLKWLKSQRQVYVSMAIELPIQRDNKHENLVSAYMF